MSCLALVATIALAVSRYSDGSSVPEDQVATQCTDAPDDTQACSPCDFCEVPGLNQECSQQGVCINGECNCTSPFTGPTCAANSNVCPSGITSSAEECCTSGLVDADGNCCADGELVELDKDGQCCSDGIDACGICGGTGVALDAEGICCSVRARANETCMPCF